MAARGTAAAPIATPSRAYGHKIAQRDYHGEKEDREELRRWEAEERRKQREMGSSVDLGAAGTQWKAVSAGASVAMAKQKPKKKKKTSGKDALDLWWAQEKGDASLAVVPANTKQKRQRQRKKASAESTGPAMPAKQGETWGDYDWKLWGSREAHETQGWQSWDGAHAQAGGVKTPNKTSKPIRAPTVKAKPKAAPKKAKPEKVDVWNAWNVPQTQHDEDRGSREIFLSGYLGPDLSSNDPPAAAEEEAAASPATCEQDHPASSLEQCVDQPANALEAGDDQAAEPSIVNPEEPETVNPDVSCLQNRLVQFLQHRDKGDDVSRQEAKDFLRTVARQEREVGVFGKLSLDDVELAICSWERLLWCMAWLREKGKDDVGKAAAVLRHAARKGIEFAGVGALKVDEVEYAVEEYEQECLPEQSASDSDSADSEDSEDDDNNNASAEAVESAAPSDSVAEVAKEAAPAAFAPPQRLPRFQ